METKIKINHRQMAWMVTVILTAGGFLTTPKTLVALSKADAWLTQIAGMVYALFIAALLYYLARRFPGKSLFEITFELLGKWGGGLCNFLFLLHIFTILIRDMGVFSDFMNTTLLIRTPGEIIVLLMILLVVYFASSSVEVAVRVNDLIFPLFLGMLLAVPLLLGNEFDLRRIEPIFGQGYHPVLGGNLIAWGWYDEILIVGAFMGMLGSSKKLYAALRHGVMSTALLMTMVLFFTVAVLGIEVAARLMYPNYSLVEQIHITDYLDRIELFMFSVWLPIFLLKIAFKFLAILHIFSAFAGRMNLSLYGKQAGWLLLLLWSFAFKSVTEVFNFANYGTVLISAPDILICLLLYLAGRRRKVVDEEGVAADDRPQPQKKQKGGIWQWAIQQPERRWQRITNYAATSAVLIFLLAAYFGQFSPAAGAIGGGGILLALIIGYTSSYLEMRQANYASVRRQQKAKQRRRAG
ncbi:spore germination protein (amino acid permease) [Tumebacillus sp. BK434]|uniref:GerAB/ArcD/ProY family transporter n=1 Tax=Tumebacillus sp. BK434 TaxID=2512169 RepID=UPI00104FB65E|nr:endospore germination permease [Tumebacillus sp. BK434]TCP57620.1 spore germination protein (amino acid permease) [Tumebacillus sp. BK434]